MSGSSVLKVDLYKDLTSSDRFVRYQSKKAYTTFLKNHKSYTDLFLDILLDKKQSEHHAICLEIGAEILSRQCSYCQNYAEEISSKLIQYCHEFFDVLQKMDSQSTFCLFKVLGKYAKLIHVFGCKPALTFTETIITDFKNGLIDILFKSDFPWYVRRQIIKYLSNIMKVEFLTLKDTKGLKIMELNFVLVEKLVTIDLEAILYSPYCGGFSGQELVVDKRGELVDVACVMEWSYLIILSASIQIDKDSEILIKLDSVLKQKFGQDKDILLSWLPEIFSNQDDMWIDVLYTLISQKSKECSTDRSASIQNHWYFLQFINAIGYDHQILVDFLTSPETNFLAYLMRYLKFLISSWIEFKQVVEHFQVRLETCNSSICMASQSSSNDRIVNDDLHITVVNVKHSNQMFCCKSEENCILNENNGNVTWKENVLLSRANECISGLELEMDFKDDTLSVFSEKNNGFTSDSVTAQHNTTQKISGGLGLINEMYNKSDSESNDDSTSDDHIDDSEIDLSYENSSWNNYATSDDLFSLNVTDTKFPKRDESNIEVDSSTSSAYQSEKISTTAKEVLNDCQESVTAVRKGDETILKEGLNDEGLSQTDSDIDTKAANEETHVLDSVIGALVRVCLKLERVWKNEVITYNPKPLISLIHRVEQLYEN